MSYIKIVIAKENQIKEGIEDYKHMMCETTVPFFKLLSHCYSDMLSICQYVLPSFSEKLFIDVT